MNVTEVAICETCQTKNGLSSADQRSIIVLVLLTGLALVSCFVSVLWFAYRTRSLPEKDTNITTTHNNEAFNYDELDYNDYIQPVDNTRRATTASTQHIRLADENERYP